LISEIMIQNLRGRIDHIVARLSSDWFTRYSKLNIGLILKVGKVPNINGLMDRV